MRFLIIALVATAIPLSVSALDLEDYSENTGSYISSCYAQKFLKEKYCPKISDTLIDRCFQNSIDNLPERVRVDFLKSLLEFKFQLQVKGENSAKQGYEKTLNLLGNDREKTCISYASSLATFSGMKLQEMQKIGRKIK